MDWSCVAHVDDLSTSFSESRDASSIFHGAVQRKCVVDRTDALDEWPVVNDDIDVVVL